MINELIVGGLIYHIVHDKDLPFNPVMYRSNIVLKFENKVNLIIGRNSIKETLIGVGYDISVASHPTLGSINVKLGAYWQDENMFEYKNIVSPFGGDIVPVIGMEFNIPYKDNWGVSTTITPLLTFTGIYFRF